MLLRSIVLKIYSGEMESSVKEGEMTISCVYTGLLSALRVKVF